MIFRSFPLEFLLPTYLNHMIQQYLMKKQIVSIDFRKDQGLVLKWNYVDLTKRNQYFRHIIVLLTSSLEAAKITLEHYLQQLKLGDLYTVIYRTALSTLQVKDWREKTNRTHLSSKDYLIEELHSCCPFQFFCPLIQKEILQSSEPTVLNLVLQKQEEICNLKNKIKQMQVQQKISFITTIFSPNCSNHISISDGINTLSTLQPAAFEFYHQYINQMAIQYAHLVITCRNGEIYSYSQNCWKNTAFNKIERSYYGPSVRYIKDALHFINSKIVFSGSYDLDIQLKFKCFGGKLYTSEKKIAINFDHNEVYTRTVCAQRKPRTYYFSEDLELEETPYESETLIYFQKIKEGTSKDQQ